MTERAFVADAREAKGLHDGSITRVVRVVELCDFGPSEMEGYDWQYRRPECDNTSIDLTAWYNIFHEDLLAMCPFGVVGDRLRVVDPGTYPADVCMAPPSTLLDVTDVRVVRLGGVTPGDCHAAGCPERRVPSYIMPYGYPTARGRDAALDDFRKLFSKAIIDANPWLWLGTVKKVD